MRPGLTTLSDNNEYKNDPGVSFFYNAEWASPQEWHGKLGRLGKHDLLWGGPNFWLNGVEPTAQYEIELKFWTDKPGDLRVWTGGKFEPIGRLSASNQWQTVCFVLPAQFVHDAGGTANINALLELTSPEIRVAKIAVRKLAQAAP